MKVSEEPWTPDEDAEVEEKDDEEYPRETKTDVDWRPDDAPADATSTTSYLLETKNANIPGSEKEEMEVDTRTNDNNSSLLILPAAETTKRVGSNGVEIIDLS